MKIIREKDDLNNDEKAWIRKEIERVGTLEKGKIYWRKGWPCLKVLKTTSIRKERI